MKVLLDLNFPDFQEDWFKLEKKDFLATKNTLRKLSTMDWQQVFKDRGLRWEKIQSAKTEKGRDLYSIRLSKKFRAVVHRSGAYMAFVSLHPDHDSAYTGSK